MAKGELTWETIGNWLIILAAAVALLVVLYFLKDTLFSKFETIKNMFSL